MKALTNILTRLLMLLMIFIMACTEEAAEVDNLSRQEQHVTVRMQVPGMTATTTRAADDDAITSITALAFGSEGNLLGTSEATNISNVNADGGYNGTFTLSVPKPNDTKTIHFLANLPNNVNIPQSGSQTDVLRGLTTTDTSNLIYWGVAEYTGSNLFVDLYRNMAMIAIAPAVVDTEFNEFEENELFIAGLYNANQSGTLVPYKEAFNFNLNENDYYTLPEPLDKSNVEYNEPYSASTYVFEHENTRREPLCAICEIGESFYKVALVDDRTGEPYDIIRNHKYIIYVSDVDDYQTSTYQADSYENALKKEPINLDVDEVKMVSFIYNEDASLNLNNNETFSVTVNVPDVKGGSLTAIYIETNDFDVTDESGLTVPNNEGVYTYTPSMGSKTTLTFTPKSAGSKSIVITGEAENMEVPYTPIDVAVNATINAAAKTSTTLYYDATEAQTVTVDVTIPKGVTALSIAAPDFTTIEKTAGDGTLDGTTYTPTNTNGQRATFVFTLNKSKFTDTDTSTITFSDDDESKKQYVTSGEVSIDVKKTPVATNTLTVTPITKPIIDLSEGGSKIVQLSLSIPSDLSYLRVNTDYAFTVTALQGSPAPRAEAPNYYYDYISPGSVSTIELELAISDKIFGVEGEYPITFYASQNSSEGITTTISVVNNDLEDGIIWKGSKEAVNAGYILNYASFANYRESNKQLKIDIETTGDGWKQFYVKYEGDNNYLLSQSGYSLDNTLSLDIPSEDRKLIISGQADDGIITITKIYIE